MRGRVSCGPGTTAQGEIGERFDGQVGDAIDEQIGVGESIMWMGVCDGDDGQAGGAGCFDTGGRVFDRDALRRGDGEPTRCEQIAIGIGLGTHHVVGGDDRIESVQQAELAQHRCDFRAPGTGTDGDGGVFGCGADQFDRSWKRDRAAGIERVEEGALFERTELVAEFGGQCTCVGGGDGLDAAHIAATDAFAQEQLVGQVEADAGHGRAERVLVQGLGIGDDAVEVEDDAAHGVDCRIGRLAGDGRGNSGHGPGQAGWPSRRGHRPSRDAAG